MPTTDNTNDKKVLKILSKVQKFLNRSKLTVPELIVFYGNLGYHIGASIAGFEGSGPSEEELKRAYYENPTVDVGLMLQGLTVTGWEHDFLKQPRLSNLARNRKEK